MRELVILLFVFVSLSIQSQVVPDELYIDWTNAGLESEIIDPAIIVDVSDFGAIPDDFTIDTDAFLNAIASLNNEPGIVLIPAGEYILTQTLDLHTGVIIKGVDSSLSILTFNLNNQINNCFSVIGNSDSEFQSIVSGFTKGSANIEVSDGVQFSSGDYIEIEQDNGNWDSNSIGWADNSVGQIIKISSVFGNFVSLDSELRIDFDSELHPRVRKINPVRDVRIESLTIERIDNPDAGNCYNFFFDNSVNCEVKDVESIYSSGSHIYFSRSLNCQVTGSYIHDSWGYDGAGTRGYGVTLNMHTSEVLIENNIFKKLRHAMMVKTGANGNVFGYNYSIEPFRSEPINDYSGDISLHGHFAFSNLFEGNIIQNIIIDHYWGPSGPYNTFLRNRLELYGFIMTVGEIQTNDQNIVGLDIPNQEPFKGQYTITGIDHFEYANRLNDNSVYPDGTDDLQDSTYYLSGKPEWWIISDPWPSIGIPNLVDTLSIPARDRYLGVLPINIPINESDNLMIYPNPVSNFIHVINPDFQKNTTISILSLDGNEVMRIYLDSGIEIIDIQNLASGVYILKFNSKNIRFIKL